MQTRAQKIFALVEWCVQKGYTPNSSSWQTKVTKYAIYLFKCQNKTAKSYAQTLLQIFSLDKWCDIVLKSQNLSISTKNEWFQKNELNKTLPDPYLECASSSLTKDSNNLRALVFDYLDLFPESKPKDIAVNLGLSYNEKNGVLTKYRSEWRKQSGFGKAPKTGNNGISLHKGRWEIWVPKNLDREAALELGWGVTSNKNGMMFFPKDGGDCGTIFWYVNGHVFLTMHKGYVKMGHVKSLFCSGFNRLLESDKVLLLCLEKIRHVGGHFVKEVKHRLPYVEVNEFRESHGIRIKLGDRSHPNGVEVEYGVPSVMKPLEKMLSLIHREEIERVWKSKNIEAKVRSYII